MRDQRSKQIVLALADREMERRVTELVDRIRIRSAFDEQDRGLFVPARVGRALEVLAGDRRLALGRQEERGPAFGCVILEPRARGEEQLRDCRIADAACEHQRREPAA